MSKDIWERRNIENLFYYDVHGCRQTNSLSPGDCRDCGGPCIYIKEMSYDIRGKKVIYESCMFCGVEYMKWER